jgi:Leucine-rich repeat (LRR) protein
MKITTLLKSIIVEASNYEIKLAQNTKPTQTKEGKKVKAKMSKEVFDQLVQADPTTRLNNVDLSTEDIKEFEKVKAGKYVDWIVKSFLNIPTETQHGDPNYPRELKMLQDRFLEDLYKISDDLKKYERFKGRLPLEQRQIQNLTPEQLYNSVKDFDLTMATTTKAERKSAPVHPGGKLIYDSPDLRVVEISDKGPTGKEAACFYGGNNQETRWCTSAPGLSHFEYYVGKGPLYVIYNPSDPNVSHTTGLPMERYQINFETDSYMDRHDHRFDIVEKLNGPWKELKPIFKSKFAKGLTEGGGTSLRINGFSSGNVGKFVSLYGLEELINAQPESLTELQIRNNEKNGIVLQIPDSIKRFKDLELILLQNCVETIPDAICELKNLNFLSLMDNPKLKTVPECIADMPNLMFLNTKGSDNVKIPEKIRKKAKSKLGDYMLDFQP